MDIIQAVRLIIANALRVVHIALWLTIPTAVWLWLLLAEPKTDKCLYHCCSFCDDNVLGVSFVFFLFIVFGLFVFGASVSFCWIGGYCVEILYRVFRGDSTLPPVRRGVIRQGWWLLGPSLWFWLPFIAVFLAAHAIRAKVFPWDFTSMVLETLPVVAAVVVFWGYLVGFARGVVHGERSLLWRRRENMRLALSNIKATVATSLLLFVVVELGIVVWEGVSGLLFMRRDLDLMTEAALGSFVFYFVLLSCSIACSHVVARYARRIGVGDQLSSSAEFA